MASITIVDEISRVAKNMINLIESDYDDEIDINFVNKKNLQDSINIITANYTS